MSYDELTECRWNVWLWRTIPLLQVLFGTVGNVLNIIILQRKRLQRNSSSVYLSLLAVADSCTLWFSTFPEILLRGFGRDIKASSQFSCIINNYVAYVAGGYSLWLVVLLTIERMMLTKCPVFSRLHLTRRTALITTLVCLVISVGFFTHIPYRFGIEDIVEDHGNGTIVRRRSCISLSTFDTTIWLILIWFLFNLIPMILLVIANGVIIVTIIVQRKRFGAVNPVGRVNKQNTYKKTKSSTKMVLLISAFLS